VPDEPHRLSRRGGRSGRLLAIACSIIRDRKYLFGRRRMELLVEHPSIYSPCIPRADFSGFCGATIVYCDDLQMCWEVPVFPAIPASKFCNKWKWHVMSRNCLNRDKPPLTSLMEPQSTTTKYYYVLESLTLPLLHFIIWSQTYTTVDISPTVNRPLIFGDGPTTNLQSHHNVFNGRRRI
jgi:hypothetical protein